MLLKHIQSHIQQIVDAISAVLKIEVEVSDRHLLRIAGTGQLKEKIWKAMDGEDIVYRQCIEKKETIIIEKPGFEVICQQCLHYQQCIEKGEVCCPIIVSGEVVGVLGLIAFDEEQRLRLFTNLEENVLFLEKMADLISSKMSEHLYYNEQLLTEKKISTIINYIDHGVIMLNNERQCEFINDTAKTMLKIHSEEEIDDGLIDQLMRYEDYTPEEGQVVTLQTKDRHTKLFINYIHIQDFRKGYVTVIILNDPSTIANKAFTISSIDEHSQKILGSHSSIVKIKSLIQKTAGTTLPILIEGEVGTGKEFVAKYIHHKSMRTGQFISINCAYYDPSVLEQLLFGKNFNKLTEAADGTLYIEEIDTLPLKLQLELLHYLNNGKASAVSGTNTRIIASTTKPLFSLVQQGIFRQDLYFKLNMIHHHTPPLRMRKDDILEIAIHFVTKHCDLQNRRRKKLNPEVVDILLGYDWPGNIQELSYTIEYVIKIDNGPIVSPHHLPEYIVQAAAKKRKASADTFNLQLLERETIKRALDECERSGKKKEEAAQLLGIGRATLFRKIKEYNLYS